MNQGNGKIMPIFLYGLSVAALFLFLNGFFPVDNSYKIDKLNPLKRDNYAKYTKNDILFKKMVLIVIDALRFDFVTPTTSSNYMPFTTSSITDNKSCLVKLRAHSPTVTMPRIKAMTSGIIPTYFDVVSNFMDEEFKADSFINQAVLNNFKIVFYGDDTWLKLFPNAFFRFEGTNSFFASDYTEVDDNVTRHLDDELKKRDWDFLILHYLGLDHIGHMDGPKSSLVQPKLKEMDSIIFKIFQYVQKMEEEGISTLFVVTSDHGMKDSGGHGGVTEAEVLLPLVSVGKSCSHIPGWPADYTAEQIDLSPTIATAFGLSMPDCNVGKIIPSILHGMDAERVLQLLELNRIQLRLRAGLPENDFSSEEETNAGLAKLRNISETKLKVTVEKYFYEISQLSADLRSTSSFNIIFLALGISVMWIILILTASTSAQHCRPRRVTHYFLLLGTFLHGLSFSSTSLIEEEHQTWYFLWVTKCILIVFDMLGQSKCTLFQNIKNTMPWLAILFAHRMLKKLNQTGDKWAMLPDLKTFLNLPENRSFLTLIYILGLSAIILCAFSEKCTKWQLLTLICAIVVNLFYRLAVSSVHLFFLNFYPKSRGSTECSLFWALTAVFAVTNSNSPLVWTLVASILVKPHNIVLVPAAFYVNKQINRLYKNPEDNLWNCITHFWVGFVFYFYQGNSNSLANVDVSAGFTGLDEYNPVYTFTMVAVHTNFSHILAYSFSPKCHAMLPILWLFPVTLYCTVLLFQLNHLFIWSVFSPKLLYETNFLIIYLFLLSFDYIGYFISHSLSLFKKKLVSMSCSFLQNCDPN